MIATERERGAYLEIDLLYEPDATFFYTKCISVLLVLLFCTTLDLISEYL